MWHQWIRCYDHLRRFQNSKVRTHLNGTLYTIPFLILSLRSRLFSSILFTSHFHVPSSSTLPYSTSASSFAFCLLHISFSTIITFLYIFSLHSHTCMHSKPYLKQNEMHVAVSYAIPASCCNELQHETRQPKVVRLKGKAAGICSIQCALELRRHVYVEVCT